MKKTLAKILGCVLTLSMLLATLVGCGGGWKGTNMTDWGEGNIVGGFIGQTTNYVYFVNGLGDSTADNEFGTPVKGSLMAADKSDLSNAEVVVPKIFGSNDYTAGFYVYDDYVYYGTPNTETNSGGNVANDELIIMQTKLDGTETKEIVGIGSLTAQYRVVEKDGNVYVVYYDVDENALVSYDVNNASKNIIAKSDDTVEGVGSTSLANYVFLDNECVEQGVAVAYTVSIFSEEYYEEKAEQTGYQRAVESYNKLYVYVAGEEQPTILKDGTEEEITYSIDLSNNGYVFYTATDSKAKAEKSISYLGRPEFSSSGGSGINPEVVIDGAVIKGPAEIYILDGGRIYKTEAAKDKATEKEVVAIASRASSLIDIFGGYAYYFNTAGKIARVELYNEQAEEQEISDNTASQAWFAPVIMNVAGTDYMFYLDNSAEGCSYVEYVDLSAEVKEEKDDDGETVKWYIEGQTLLGKMIDKDAASIVDSKISALPNGFAGGKLVLKDVDGVLVNEEIEEIRAIINELDKAVKDLVSEDLLETLAKYENAIEKANLYYQLKDMRNYNVLPDADQAAVKDIYNQVKGKIEAFRNSSEYSEIVAFIDHNYLNLYQSAVEVFDAK